MQFYTIFATSSMIYSVVNFIMNKHEKEYQTVSNRQIYKSTYQLVTGNYNLDFILKLIAYLLLFIAWQIPFLVVMAPRTRRSYTKYMIKGSKNLRLTFEDPRDSTN